jgi:hypothetical protein
MVGLLLAIVGAAAGIAYGRLVAPVQYVGAQSADAVSGEALAFARSVSYAGPDLALLEELNRAMQALAPLPSPVGTP